MRKCAFLVCLSLGIFAWSGPAEAQEVDRSYFFERLSPYGRWLQHRQHGWVWSPRGVEVGWRPYTCGQWLFVGDEGWLWCSDFEWGWACFHYGRWFWDDDEGWLWVPGSEWAPAWVVWRQGDGYVGWAPLPIGIPWRAEVGLVLDGVDWDIVVYAPSWVFVLEREFLNPRLRRVREHSTRRASLLLRSRIMGQQLACSKRRVRSGGPSVEGLRRVTRRPIQPVRLTEVKTLGALGVPDAGSHKVFRPRVRGQSAGAPPSAEDLARIHAARLATLEERHRAQRALIERAPAQRPRPRPGEARPPENREARRAALLEQQRRERQRLERLYRRSQPKPGERRGAPREGAPRRGRPPSKKPE